MRLKSVACKERSGWDVRPGKYLQMSSSAANPFTSRKEEKASGVR